MYIGFRKVRKLVIYMNIKEFYNEIGGNYSDVLSRLSNEALITKIVKKFNEDPSFSQLEEALDSGNIDLAFRAAHTLKGISLNLSFDKLSKDAIEITEILRAGKLDGTKELFDSLKKTYDETISKIKELD